jgi:hypothetical protein
MTTTLRGGAPSPRPWPFAGAHELRSPKTMENQRPLAHATSGMGEGWGEGSKPLGVSTFRRKGQGEA